MAYKRHYYDSDSENKIVKRRYFEKVNKKRNSENEDYLLFVKKQKLTNDEIKNRIEYMKYTIFLFVIILVVFFICVLIFLI